MENNQLSGRGIFDIIDWNEFISLNGLLGQIQLASELETKINQFKYNFLKSKLYTFEQLLRKDDVCWLDFKYIKNRTRYEKTQLYRFLGEFVIIETPLRIKDQLVPHLYQEFNNSNSLLYHLSDYVRVAYKKIQNIPENDKIMKQLYLQQSYFRGKFSLYNKFCDKYNYKYSNLYDHYSDTIIKNFDSDDLALINSILFLFTPERNEITKLNKLGIPNHSYDIEYSNYSNQTRIIDILGGKDFLDKINKKFEPTINKIRSYYLSLHKDWKNDNIPSNPHHFLFILNRYNQPFPVVYTENIKNISICIKNGDLNFVTGNNIYRSENDSFYNYDSSDFNSYRLVFDSNHGELKRIYGKENTRTDDIDQWKLVSKTF